MTSSILTTHVGSLPRSKELSDLLFAKDKKEELNLEAFNQVVNKNVEILNSVLWENVQVQENVKIEDSIIADGVTIGEGATIESSVLASGSTVPPRKHLKPGTHLLPGERYDETDG